MKAKFSAVGAVVAAGLLSLGLALGAPGTARADVAASKIPASCMQVNKFGDQVWKGEPSAELTDLSDDLYAIESEFADQIAGSEYCSDHSGIIVAIKPKAPDAIATRLASLQAEYPDYTLYMKHVAVSNNELLQLIDKVSPSIEQIPGVLGYESDPLSGGLVIEYDTSLWPDSAKLGVAVKGALNGGLEVPIKLRPVLLVVDVDQVSVVPQRPSVTLIPR